MMGLSRRYGILNLFILLLTTLVLIPHRAIAQESEYLGAAVCGQCHQTEYRLWKDSDHDLAMQEATPETVLGNFNDVTFDHYGEKTRFSRSDTEFFVTTDNAEGKQQTFKVAYTFGVYPLQQYLIPTDKGRFQALSVSWDARPKEQGGQRWFHLYPNEAVPAGDSLHWTGTYQNWNSRCADCHSTNLQRNYNETSDSYNTTWSEIDVACEACHGPGKVHVDQIKSGKHGQNTKMPSLSPATAWLRSANEATAHRLDKSGGEGQKSQLDVCGSCHSRRSVLDDPAKTDAFHQKHSLSLISEPMYFADGQIREEDYVLGSFLQSKMHQRGVVCSNCHEPHSLKLRAEGNQVCSQCHNPKVFDKPEHHHHKVSSTGSQCVNCHMPQTTYMVVDPRRDHSIRIPRPDLSVEFDTPNACTQCHSSKSAEWAAKSLNGWLKSSGKSLPENFSEQLLRGLRQAGGGKYLLNLAGNREAPDIVRASALQGLRSQDNTVALLSQQLLTNDSAMLRAAAVEEFSALPITQRLRELSPLFIDSSKQVRTAVAQQVMAATPKDLAQTLSTQQQKNWQVLMTEYRQTLSRERDVPSGQVALGIWSANRGDYAAAIDYYRRALGAVPELPAASLNLADVYRELGQDKKGETVLTEALTHNKDNGLLEHSLGLNLIRQKKYTEAENHLQRATLLSPENPRFGYIYGTLLQHLGKSREAEAAWQRALTKAPDDQEVLIALLQLSRSQQQWSTALHYAQRLQILMPDSPELRQMITYLQQRAAQ